MKKYKVTIQGVSNYLQNRFPLEQAKAAKPRSRKAGNTESPEEAQAKLDAKSYVNDAGFCYIPSSHLEGSLILAAKDYKVPGKGRKSYKDIFKGSVWVEDNEILFSPNKKKPDTVFETVVRNPGTGGRMPSSRPCFLKGWKSEFNLLTTTDAVDKELLQAVLDAAGLATGIGDYRPKYGRFEVLSIKEVK